MGAERFLLISLTSTRTIFVVLGNLKNYNFFFLAQYLPLFSSSAICLPEHEDD
jgi:hypothetical protein